MGVRRMTEKIIMCPMKVVEIFPWGKVLVPDIKKLKRKLRLTKFKKIETMKVPIEIKLKKKDGTTVVLKAKRIVKKTSKTGNKKKEVKQNE